MGQGNKLFYVQGEDIMHFTDSCRFLISSAFKFTALCTILLHCVQSYHTACNLTALCTILPHWGLEGGGMGPETSHALAYLGPMYIKIPMDVFFIQPCM